MPNESSKRLIARLLFLLQSLLYAQLPTDGFVQYQDTFYVQKPYNLDVSQRFSDTGGMYTCWIFPSDKPFQQGNTTGPRTEMRWNTWKDQKLEHIFEANVMYESGTNHTCIMQIKSNSSGEAMYIQVHTNGDLRNSVSTPFLRGYWDTWFNLKVSYDPATGKGRVWIDNILKVTASHPVARDWYFKNGTYCNGMTSGSVSKAHFKNIRMWIKGDPSETGLQPVSKKWRMTGATGLIITGSLRSEVPEFLRGMGADLILYGVTGRMYRSTVSPMYPRNAAESHLTQGWYVVKIPDIP